MTRIKICGLSRPCDVDYVNEAMPDFCGFVIDVPASRRNVTAETVRELRARLAPEIRPVGVFVNAPQALIVSLVQDGTLSMVQLHGQESDDYITELRNQLAALQSQPLVPLVQAFSIRTTEDVRRAEASLADHVLLDHGAGGTGSVFDWSLLRGISRPFLLAGGLKPENLQQAIEATHPWAVDLSSGVETDGKKDRGKILAAVQTARTNSTNELNEQHE